MLRRRSFSPPAAREHGIPVEAASTLPAISTMAGSRYALPAPGFRQWSCAPYGSSPPSAVTWRAVVSRAVTVRARLATRHSMRRTRMRPVAPDVTSHDSVCRCMSTGRREEGGHGAPTVTFAQQYVRGCATHRRRVPHSHGRVERVESTALFVNGRCISRCRDDAPLH